MSKSKLIKSAISLKWLNLRKFLFLFSLRTGMQIYGLTSFIISVLITDTLLIKLIEQQSCEEYRNMNDRLKCTYTKQIILLQACQAFTSALVLWFVKRPAVPLCWVGCKLAVGITELSYLTDWTGKVVSQFFNIYLSSAWFTGIFIVMNLYGVLVAISYYATLLGKQASYTLSSKTTETNVNIPIPPELPNF